MRKLIISLILCGAALSCSHKDQLFESMEKFDLPTTTRSEASIDEAGNSIAQIIEEKLLEYKNRGVLWGTVVIMDVESGYTRTINCTAYDDTIGQAKTNYAEEPIDQGSIFLPIPFMTLLDDGGMKPTDIVNLEESRQQIGGILVVDPFKIETTTFSDAFTKSSNIAIVKGCYERLNLTDIDDLYLAMGYGKELSLVKMLRAYNVIANRGKYIDIKYDVDEPIKVLEESCFSEWATEECKDCMVQHAKERGLEDMAIYSGVAQSPYHQKYWDRPFIHTMTHAGFFPIDNPKYSILVSFRTRSAMWSLGDEVIPKIVELLK